MPLTIAISNDVDQRASGILRKLDDVEIAESSPQSVLITEDAVSPVRIELVEADELEDRIRAERGDDELLVINAVLDDDAAARLEDANASYIDAAGRRWLRNWARTKRATETTTIGGKRRLYAASVRLAQLLADHPLEPWTERGLARRGQTTQTTAHRLLSRLEAEGLLVREGRGPSTLRWVRDAATMRSWLAREGRPRRVARLTCFVENPERPPKAVGRSLALTGSVGAAEIGMPVMTRAVMPTMRVSVRPEELEDVPEAIGGFRTEQGPNLTLIADPDRLAFVDAAPTSSEGRLLAPPSRIMLDLFLEARGEAAVDVFLSLWGNRSS